MYLKDIRFNILLKTDIKDISQYCCVDKLYNDICSNKLFWLLYYEKNTIPFIKYDYINTYEWVKSFVLMSKAVDLIDYIENKYQTNFICSNYNDISIDHIFKIRRNYSRYKDKKIIISHDHNTFYIEIKFRSTIDNTFYECTFYETDKIKMIYDLYELLCLSIDYKKI